jgi:hypothetical protein
LLIASEGGALSPPGTQTNPALTEQRPPGKSGPLDFEKNFGGPWAVCLTPKQIRQTENGFVARRSKLGRYRLAIESFSPSDTNSP